jgi:hypothetical protein
MGTITKVIKVCDRCGHQHDQDTYRSGNAWGQASLAWHGELGSRAWDGAAAGVSLKGNAYLCMACTEQFVDWMARKT